MIKNSRLQPVIKLKQRREQQAGDRLRQTNGQRQHHQQLVGQLKTYRDGYVQQMSHQLKAGVVANHLGDYRYMVAQLDEAISREKTALQWAQNDWQQAHKVWQIAYSQVEALAVISRGYDQDSRRQAETLEQDQQEDIHRNLRR